MPASADLRPLQVLQNRHRPPLVSGQLADIGDNSRVLTVLSVREVEAGHVHAGGDQFAETVAAGRADSTDDFSATRIHYNLPMRSIASSILSR